MWLLSVPSHRHSSSVCFFFISILSAAGTAGVVGQAQVVADDLPRSGEATRGGEPGRAEGRQLSFQLTLSPSAASSCQRLCSERTAPWQSRRAQRPLIQFSQEVDSMPGALHHSGWSEALRDGIHQELDSGASLHTAASSSRRLNLS